MRGRPARRVGVFGGTFDPPHLGHLLLAEAAREHLRLSEVRFVPARVPPHKRGRDVSPVAARLALLRAALRGTGFRLDTQELSRVGPSYTVDTLEALHRRDPGASLHLIVGADSLLDLMNWRAPERVLALARLAVAGRPGFPVRRLAKGLARRVDWLPVPPVGIASRELRASVRAGRSIRFQVPPAVGALIARLGLYRA